MKIIRRLFIGCLLIFFTPLLSILFAFGTYYWVSQQRDYLVPIMVHVGINLAVIGVLIIGTVLYFLGYKESQMNMAGAKITFILGLLLVAWGTPATLMASGSYLELIRWSRMPQVRELTVWDYLEYGSWMLKGTLWIVSGILLTMSANRRMESKRIA